MKKKQIIGLLGGPMIFLALALFFRPEGLSIEGTYVLAATAWTVIWWITEAIPIPVTSLLPLVLFPLLNALDIKSTAPNYTKPLIFLFVGGFMVALAMEKWQLHKRIALLIISRVGTKAHLILLGFMLATALLSMWISNTATTVMMVPIAIAIVAQFGDFMKGDSQFSEKQGVQFGKALMLSIAYAASIGGMATLIGTPTNIILSGFIQEWYPVEISFLDWMMIGLPVSALLLYLAWIHLVKIAFRIPTSPVPGGHATIQKELQALGPISPEEKRVFLVFGLMAFAWVIRKPILSHLIPHIDDTIIALIAAVSLFIIPSSKKGERLMDWETANKLPWGILLLFGAGFAIAAGFESTELSSWIGSQLTLLQGISLLLIVLAITLLVNFLTELTMNMATCTMILPILGGLALGINVHPYALMISATLAASCAFMLPIATAPNAIVFGSGKITMQDMARTGFVLNLVSVLVIGLLVYLLLPLFWGIELQSFPEGWEILRK